MGPCSASLSLMAPILKVSISLGLPAADKGLVGERMPSRHGWRPCCMLLWYREHRGTWHDGTACAGALHSWRGDAVKELGLC